MSFEKQWRMVRLMLERTSENLVEWAPGLDDNSVQIEGKRYTIVLKQSPSDFDEDAFDYLFSIMNETGDVVDQFTDGDLIGEFADSIQDRLKKPYAVIDRLYNLARRKARGADKIIDQVINDLENPF